jgi:hypothetical protein
MSTLMNAPQYDDRREKRRTKTIWLVVVLILIALGFLYYTRNWRYERKVDQFFSSIEHNDLETAYGIYQADPAWKSHPQQYKNYPFGQFSLDWGPSGDWGPIRSHHIDCSARIGSGVIAAVTINGRPERAYMWVEKKDMTLTQAPSHLQLQCGSLFAH